MAVKKTTKVKKEKKETGLKAPVLGTDGKSRGTITLPETYFEAKPNKQLIAQAVRVYLANQRVGHASTKTRGRVEGSTRKIYKQKGTGRARHGSIRAPIFVGGGIVFGPSPRDYHLDFPQKMKKAALVSSLSQKFKDGKIIFVSGFTDLKPKTKLYWEALQLIGAGKHCLIVVPKEAGLVSQSVRNIEGVDVLPVSDIHTYAIMAHQKIIFMKEAVIALKA